MVVQAEGCGINHLLNYSTDAVYKVSDISGHDTQNDRTESHYLDDMFLDLAYYQDSRTVTNAL